MDSNVTIWGIHTTEDNLFLNQNLIAIGWDEMGNLSDIKAVREDYKEKYISAYPDAKKGNVAVSVGILYRFVCEVKKAIMLCFHQK